MKNKFVLSLLAFGSISLFLSGCSQNNEIGDNEHAIIRVIDGTGGGLYKIGDSVTITANNKTNQEFKEWQLENNFVSSNNPYTFIAEKNAVYKAVFENIVVPPTQKVTITVNNGTGSGEYEVGSIVYVSANVPEGMEFVDWRSNNEIVSTSNPYTFIAVESIELTPTFKKADPFSNYKKTVYKKSGEDFKILNLTDIQLHDGENVETTLDVIDQLVEKEQPDMITFLGDLLNDDPVYKSLINSSLIIDKIDSYDIPWAPIFGNHDYEDYQAGYESMKTMTSKELANKFIESSNCLFTFGPEGVSGLGNYIVEVVDEETEELVEELFFLDSRLSGLTDSNAEFYKNALENTININGSIVPSAIFTHIAIPEYGDAYETSTQCEYQDVVGSINRNPCDLATGSRLLFKYIKDYESTDIVICGHDHENAYYTDYEGVRLAYSMKSSLGDKYTNIAELGGSILKIGDEQEFYYTHADISFEITDSYSFCPDTLPFWQYSGARLCFDIDIPNNSRFTMSLLGTNLQRASVEMKDRLGEWNRLSQYINYANGSFNYGQLLQIEGTKYHYELDLSNVPLNNNPTELSLGDETLRLIYIDKIELGNSESIKLSNIHYKFEEIVESDQIDLSAVQFSSVSDQFLKKDIPSKPAVSVSLNGIPLRKVDDVLFRYSNNLSLGVATISVVPSGKGAHRYKGSATTTFNIVSNPGHKEAADSNWNRLTTSVVIDFASHTCFEKNSKEVVGSFTVLSDGWWNISIPFADFTLNKDEGALGNENETLTLCNFANVTRSFKIDNIRAK